MTPEDRASKIMAECVAKNGGENVAFYLAQAIREAVDDEREACRRAVCSRCAGVAAAGKCRAEAPAPLFD